MDVAQKRDLQMKAGEGLSLDHPMKTHTTFQVGGEAEAFYNATDLEGLAEVVAYLVREQIPYWVIGKGSNILVKDEGVKGVVIRLSGSLAGIQYGPERNTLMGGAGVSIQKLLLTCRDRGLGGLEFLSGIPGTLGGAVAMNAGAFGKEVGEWVEAIRVITPAGGLLEREKEDLQFSYRSLQLERGAIITFVRVELESVGREAVSERMAGYLRQKKGLQPLGYPSAGSVFKNPVGDYAGRLIEAAGLKGKRVAGAMISRRHANFIVNTGGATASDILALMNLVQQEVNRISGIQLEPEIRILGESA
ncbi:MAG: UDP-N-acetylmuramate dehydrogenase [Desulfobacteraceae bacterium]